MQLETSVLILVKMFLLSEADFLWKSWQKSDILYTYSRERISDEKAEAGLDEARGQQPSPRILSGQSSRDERAGLGTAVMKDAST